MHRTKHFALIFGVLAMSLAVSYLIFAWQEPTQAPPSGNISTPINVGTEPQAKAGRISATEFYDYNDPNYYLNPSGDSNLDGNLKVGGSGDINGNLQVGGIPSWSGKSFSGWVNVPIAGTQDVCKNVSCSGGWGNCSGNCQQTCVNAGCSALGTYISGSGDSCDTPCGQKISDSSTINVCTYWSDGCNARKTYYPDGEICGGEPIYYQCMCSCPSSTYFWMPAFQ